MPVAQAGMLVERKAPLHYLSDFLGWTRMVYLSHHKAGPLSYLVGLELNGDLHHMTDHCCLDHLSWSFVPQCLRLELLM